jgi:ABC-type branched-subunit amino acid transport system substrate-binding protein
MLRRAFVLLVGALGLAACVPAGPPGTYPPPYGLGPPVGPAYPQPGPPGERRVALLLPLTGQNAALGQAMLNAARLALGASGAPALDVKDTGGTPAGALRAAEEALAGGTGIILGPLTAAETASVAGPATAAGVPVLAFTSDPSQARAGVWTLGLTPDQQVQRLVAAAGAKGKPHLAGLLPDNDFGHAMADALTAATATPGAAPAPIRLYTENMDAMTEAAQEIAGLARHRAANEGAQPPAGEAGASEGRKPATEAPAEAAAPAPLDALLLAAIGTHLDELASLLAADNVEPPRVQILGPALWAQRPARGNATAFLEGAWYAAPDPAVRAVFVERYRVRYGAEPPPLADLAFDAAAIARVLAERGASSRVLLTRPEGFAGADGVLALLPDGHVRRALALFEIQHGNPVVIEPAPASLAAAGA